MAHAILVNTLGQLERREMAGPEKQAGNWKVTDADFLVT